MGDLIFSDMFPWAGDETSDIYDWKEAMDFIEGQIAHGDGISDFTVIYGEKIDIETVTEVVRVQRVRSGSVGCDGQHG